MADLIRSPRFVGVAAAVVLVAGVVTVVTHTDPPTARQVVTAYVDDLAAGDATKALNEVVTPTKLDKRLLTNAVLSPGHRIHRPLITALTVKGNAATATITYTGSDNLVTDHLSLTRKHDHWRITNGISHLVVDAGIVATASTVNGVHVLLHKGKATLPAFPGIYDGVLPKQWEVSGSSLPADLTTSTGYLTIATVLTPAATAAAKQAAVAYESSCFAHSHSDQDPCGSDETGFVDQTGPGVIINTDVRWELLSPPQVITVDYDHTNNTADVYSFNGPEGKVRFSSITHEKRYPGVALAFSDIGGYTINGTVTFKGQRAVYVAH